VQKAAENRGKLKGRGETAFPEKSRKSEALTHNSARTGTQHLSPKGRGGTKTKRKGRKGILNDEGDGPKSKKSLNIGKEMGKTSILKQTLMARGSHLYTGERFWKEEISASPEDLSG